MWISAGQNRREGIREMAQKRGKPVDTQVKAHAVKAPAQYTVQVRLTFEAGGAILTSFTVGGQLDLPSAGDIHAISIPVDARRLLETLLPRMMERAAEASTNALQGGILRPPMGLAGPDGRPLAPTKTSKPTTTDG